jgi:hypothetical protein
VGGIVWAYDQAVRERNKAIQARAAAERAEGEKEKERDKAVREWQRAEKHAEGIRRQLGHSRITLADAAWREGQVALAWEHMNAVPENLRHWEWRYLNRAWEGGIFTLRGHTDALTSVALSADGQFLATASDDKMVKVWDASTGQELRSLLGHHSGVTSVVFSVDSRRIATASEDRTAKVWDAHTGQELLTLQDGVTSVAFSSDGHRIVTAGGDGTVKVWDAHTGGELLPLRGHIASVRSLAFSPDGQRLITVSEDNTAKVWDARTGQGPPDEELLVRRARTAFDPTWHTAETGRHEQSEQWFAAAFHLQQLLQHHRPDDPDLRRRLDHARQQWRLEAAREPPPLRLPRIE